MELSGFTMEVDVHMRINVEKLMFQHITWQEDCLVITLATSKCDQTGEGAS